MFLSENASFVGPRFNENVYGLRGYDRVTEWSRRVGQKYFDFSKCEWDDGSITISVFNFHSTTLIHEITLKNADN